MASSKRKQSPPKRFALVLTTLLGGLLTNRLDALLGWWGVFGVAALALLALGLARIWDEIRFSIAFWDDAEILKPFFAVLGLGLGVGAGVALVVAGLKSDNSGVDLGSWEMVADSFDPRIGVGLFVVSAIPLLSFRLAGALVFSSADRLLAGLGNALFGVGVIALSVDVVLRGASQRELEQWLRVAAAGFAVLGLAYVLLGVAGYKSVRFRYAKVGLQGIGSVLIALGAYKLGLPSEVAFAWLVAVLGFAIQEAAGIHARMPNLPEAERVERARRYGSVMRTRGYALAAASYGVFQIESRYAGLVLWLGMALVFFGRLRMEASSPG